MATEFVGIELQLMGADGVKRDLQNLDKLLDSLGGRKKFDAGFNEAKNQVVQYRGELEKLKREQSKLEKNSDEWNEKASEIENVKNKLRDAQQAVREFGRASQQAGKTFKQSFNSISSKVAHIGSAMQSLGNALTRLTSPFTRLTTGLLYGAGYKALNLFTEGLSNSFERADTMKNYDRTLRALGLDVEKTFSIAGKEAKTAKENLDDAVQGLPTSLDEIMAAQKVYAGATGEMVNSTKTAIAANNTVLASGMGDREARFMQRYLVALGSGAELTTMQWQSMARIAPLAMRAVSKELGYADKDYKQFTKDVQSGTVSGQEFLKAFQKVGTSGVVAAAARAQTESWSGLFSNIRIAVTRLGANVLETLNQTFKDKTGRTLLQQLLGWDAEGNDLGDGIKAWINGISESIQNWIRSNPDKILEFFNALKDFDWKGLMKGFAQGMADFVKVIGFFAKWASNRDMERFGRWFPRLNLLGKGLTILGGVLKGTRHIWGFLGALFPRIGKIGIFGKIASIFGKKKDIETVSETAATVTKASPKLISAFKNMALLSGIIAIPSLTAWGVTKSAKESVKNFREIIDLLKDVNWKDAAKVMGGIAAYLGGSALAGGLVGKAVSVSGGAGASVAAYVILGETVLGVITGIASAFFNFDMSQISKGIKNFVSAVKALDEIPDLEDADALFDKVENAVGVMNRITTLLNGEAPDVVTAGNMNGNGGLQGMGWLKSFDIGNLSKAIKALVEMGNSLMQLSSINLPENAQANAEAVATVASTVARSLGKIGSGFGSIVPGAGALSSWNIEATMNNVADELYQLRRMAYHISALSNVQIPIGTYGKITVLINYCKHVAKELGSFSSVFGVTERFSSGNIKATMTNVVSQLIQLRRMAYHINKLAGVDVNKAGFAETIGQIKDALAELKAVEGDFELDIEVKLATGFQSSVKNVVTSINNAKKRISTAAGKGLNITIPVRVTFSLSTNFGGVLAGILSQRRRLSGMSGRVSHSGVQEATGGMVYRAHGGGIPWKRRGTDTVPAMLTPGEYVHNKRAVNTFGIDFMRKVNNLDVKGAMNELMHRAGGMANVNRGVSITNNNYNNQKVTINNSNAGAGFTFKSASRFVGAF